MRAISRRGRTLLAALALGAALPGCTVGPDYEKPSPFSPASWFRRGGASTPPAGLASLPVLEPADPEWWGVFNDPVLTGLMRRVAPSNLDVRTASIRLAESRAQRGVAAADEFPQVNGNASYTRERISPRGVIGLLGGGGSGAGGSSGSGSSGGGSSGSGSSGGGNPAAGNNGASVATTSNGLGGTVGGIPSSGGIPAFNLFQTGFDATWELDLWGRVRRAVESADANVDASVEARRQMLVTALSELARDYIQLRGIQETERITRANLLTAQDSAHLTSERARGGLATDLEVAQAQNQVETTAADLPNLEQQEAQMQNAIALLLGAPPGALQAELSPPRPVPPVPPTVPIGLPSQLVQRRPDIRQADAQLHAATADIGQATADFFPRVTLSGSFALQAVQFKDLGNFDSRTYGLGPAISLPIFEGGRLRRTLELRRAQEQEAAVNYQRVVLGAFHDVDNALIAYRAEQARHDRLQAAAEQARRALQLAQRQYTAGLATFLDVLTAQRTVLAAEQQVATSTATVGTNLVALYKALGGGWEASYGLTPGTTPPEG